LKTEVLNWTGLTVLVVLGSPSVTFIYVDRRGVKVMMFGFTWWAGWEPPLEPQERRRLVSNLESKAQVPLSTPTSVMN